MRRGGGGGAKGKFGKGKKGVGIGGDDWNAVKGALHTCQGAAL